MTSGDYSPGFYREYARQYAQVAEEFRQSVYVKSSHPKLKHDWDLWDRLFELAPGKRGLDAGCGAGARDVLHACSLGYDVTGVDAIEENIQAARDLHPEIADRVLVADLERPLPFPDETFDFVACNAVIQHIAPEVVYARVLPELVRVLRGGGALQIMFKNGSGVVTVFDRDYGTERSFQLYEEEEVLKSLQARGMELVQARSQDQLGGLMYFTDPKPVDHCVFFALKVSPVYGGPA
jgi:SAM-dependent methyltransferase